jgi:uncharacterized integral membrane protein
MTGKYVLIIVFLILLVLFLILNNGETIVNFIFFKVQTSTAILIFISAVIGFVIGSAVAYTLRKPSKPQKSAKKV